ncbi:MAG: hypothetical protein ABSG80_02125 [Verrucomicrobiota bacterium]
MTLYKYVILCDDESSVLARVLQHYSKAFWEKLSEEAKEKKHYHIKRFVDVVSKVDDPDWKADKDLLPQLLFHLLFYEKPEEAREPARPIITSFDPEKGSENWHLGPKSLKDVQIKEWHNSWYQPFRHDIIGNTLSADLIDYLTRDPQRLGTQRRVDLHLLSFNWHYSEVKAARNRDLNSGAFPRGTNRSDGRWRGIP